MNRPIRGSCLCGGVRFEVDPPFLQASHCHCDRCRKHSGTAVCTQARVRREHFRLLQGEELIRVYGKGEGNREVGGAFSLFKGHIVGRNVELVPNQRIVQAWRVVTWPEGAYSIARFELKPRGSGTHLVFDHIGFPEGLRDHLAAGWEENYWSLLKKYFH